MSRTALRICPLCEATCGLVLTVEDGADRRITAARGDRDDVFSAGYICPKGASFAELDNDPDRLRAPLVRKNGELVETSWAEALDAAATGLRKAAEEKSGIAVYLGNPNAHTVAGALYAPQLIRALGTRQVYSASTLDQMPKQVACGYMYGNPFAFTVPDIDRTDHLVIIGANPLVSNGSVATAADFGGKLKALKRRGGRLTVIDPTRTRTAELADRHVAPRPGTDAALLFAVVHTLFDEDLVDPELGGLADRVTGVQRVRAEASEFPPEAVAAHCGLDPDDIRQLARDIAAAPSTAVYGRIGTCTVRFGTVTSWLVDVINVLTGNLDRPGGAMFASSPVGAAPRPAKPGRGFSVGRWRSRVSGHPEVCSEFPAALLPEEIETPGEGRVRALVTVAGNPVLSAPDGERLDAALGTLDFMVSIDPYLNETTRHADVILPPPPPSYSPHFDVALSNVAVRTSARYSPPVFDNPEGRPDEAEILSRLALGLLGMGTDADPKLVDEQVISFVLGREVADEHSPVAGRDVAELTAMLPDGPGYERRLDMMLRLGPFGDGFGANPDGLTLQRLKDNPHGVDLGPLTPRIPEVLRTASGDVELAPTAILDDLPRLHAALGALDAGNGAFLLIGRRHLRSNNSWMHNLPALSGGTNRCTLQIHPDDAARLGLGDVAVVTGPAGKLEVPVEITDAIRPGVVSLPHGWGHTAPGTRMAVAAGQPGVNVNSLFDSSLLDPLSGTAVLNGVPVEVTAS